ATSDTTSILVQLRELMNSVQVGNSTGIVAYIVPSTDAHQSEYLSRHDERRAFVSGFDGSAGTAVVTTNAALLWTDSRYHLQAEQQLDDNWELMKQGLSGVPSIGVWLAQNLTAGSFVGVDPRLMSFREWQTIETQLISAGIKLVPVEDNLVDKVWGNEQPAQNANPIDTLKLQFAGMTIARKWEDVRQQMKQKSVDALVVSALDEIAWLLNLRGSDIEFNPVFFSYMIVTEDKLQLFVDLVKIPADFDKHQLRNNVTVSLSSYEKISLEIRKIVLEKKSNIWIAPTSSYYLTALIPESRRLQAVTPVNLLKAVKNPVEAQGFVNSHIRDGVALCQYFAWLEHQLKLGREVDEISGAKKLEYFRGSKENYVRPSFETISASGPHASLAHYNPSNDTKRRITDKEIYLCDSGAQYLDGTTDVTRTLHFGEPTDFEKEAYTRVLKGQLSLGSAVFPALVKGQVLDTLARKALWDVGLDYGHGTGHGVGHYLNVHEGPMAVGPGYVADDPGLQANMFISNEPGFYQDDDFGIRIEDIVQIVPAQTAYNFTNRGALTFRTVTMCPKQTKMIKKELLSEAEVKLLNSYHQLVWDTLAPVLVGQKDLFTLSWLKKEVKAI
ncbi:hypothetical protein KR059_002320, partial [Drosophila kikkawai]